MEERRGAAHRRRWLTKVKERDRDVLQKRGNFDGGSFLLLSIMCAVPEYVVTENANPDIFFYDINIGQFGGHWKFILHTGILIIMKWLDLNHVWNGIKCFNNFDYSEHNKCAPNYNFIDIQWCSYFSLAFLYYHQPDGPRTAIKPMLLCWKKNYRISMHLVNLTIDIYFLPAFREKKLP